MAYEWLAPLLTPTALASVQADARPLLALLLCLLFIIAMSVLIWYISFATGKAYPKKKPEGAAAKGRWQRIAMPWRR